MKKNLMLCGIPLFFLALSACVTGSGQGSWKSYPPVPAYWDYRGGEIQVTVDHVSEDRIAAQLGVIAETILTVNGPRTIEPDSLMTIDIEVEQRSFLHGAELLNTIYISCRIRDENGAVLGRENEYITGKGSSVSSKEQHRLLKQVLGRVLKDRQRRGRDIAKYRKNKHV
jgi:hypothetical protein